MYTAEILTAIDEEITKLQQARRLLAGDPEAGKRGGRLQSAVNDTRRTISEDGRARIAAAQKKRWAAQRKASKNPA
jgi:hypothetical protein